MKPFLLCVLLGMNPSHIASIPHVYESEVVEFTRGSVFACLKGKEEKREILIEIVLNAFAFGMTVRGLWKEWKGGRF